MHTFMEHHVFAVWDFMCLLKALQRQLTCVEIPWRPTASRSSCRLINEIILGEESDEDGAGGFASHFELYVSAMTSAGASTTSITAFIDAIKEGSICVDALDIAAAPPNVRAFVRSTFEVIDLNNLCATASAFTFGREDLLPDVFEKIVAELNADSQGQLNRFEYYLKRHIELDGDQHGHMSEQLMIELCGSNPRHWERARQAALRSMESRLALWDSLATQLERNPARPVQTD